jgi:hypothetical protein
LAECRELLGPYVFSTGLGPRPISVFSKSTKPSSTAMHQLSPDRRDFRRTVVTGTARLGVI